MLFGLAGLAYLAIYLLIVGMATGWLAWVVLGKNKALVRADKKPNWGLLAGLGVAGSFIGGLGASLLAGDGFALRPTGMIGSFVGAVAAVAIYVGMAGRSK